MRTAGWYVRRLQSMTPAEMAWRARSALRDARDRASLAMGRLPKTSVADPSAPLLRLSICDVSVGTSGPHAAALVQRAERLAERRFTFSSLDDVFVGNPVEWNRDHESGLRTPMGFANAIDYRVPDVAGDAKLVWDLSRHQHLPVLGRAYRTTGDLRFARAGVEDLVSWIEQCPFGVGMNWRSPLELGIRAINWVWFLSLIEPSGVVDRGLSARLRQMLELHVIDIARKYSRGSSANNHLIGEAAGVFIVTAVMPDLPQAEARNAEARDLLEHAILEQTGDDGGSAEHAFGYHMFAFEFFLLAAIVGRHSGRAFSAAYYERLRRMLEFADAICEAGPPPLFGDYDDGFVLDLGPRAPNVHALLALGAAACGVPLRTPLEPAALEPLTWAPVPAPVTVAAPAALQSRAFEASGYYLLQWGGDARDRVSVFFDCAVLGFGSIAAHGHADALHVAVRAFGEDVLVDPGTYDYFRDLAWRDYYRSTRAHNTLGVDGEDQSVMHGSFLWGARAAASPLEWNPSPDGGSVCGKHDGYTRLPDPVTHTRRLDLSRATRSLVITDRVTMQAPHQLRLHFHLSEHARVTPNADASFTIHLDGGDVRLVLDPRLAVSTVQGGEPDQGGWVSRRYHHRAPALAITGTLLASAPTSLVSRLEFGEPR